MKDDESKHDPLDLLDERIQKAKYGDKKAKKEPSFSLARMSVELVAGVLVGVGFGIYLDKVFDLSPLFLLVGLFFGVAAGGLNIYKLASIDTKERTDTNMGTEDNTDNDTI